MQHLYSIDKYCEKKEVPAGDVIFCCYSLKKKLGRRFCRTRVFI